MKKIASFILKNKRVFISVAIALVCVVVFVSAYLLYFSNTEDKAMGMEINGVYGGDRIPLEAGTTVSQVFNAKTTFYSLASVFEATDLDKGTVFCRIYNNETGELLGEATRDISDCKGGFTAFDFTGVTFQTPVLLRAEFFAEYDGERVIYIQRSNLNELSDGILLVNAEVTVGTLPIRIVFDKLGSSFNYIYLVLAIILTAFFVLMYNLWADKRIAAHKLFLIAVIILGLLYSFILPPYSAPDEEKHIDQSFNMSSYFLGATGRKGLNPSTNYRRQCDDDLIIRRRVTTVFSYREIVENFFSTTDEPANSVVVRSEDSAITNGVDLGYILSALGITLARLLYLGYVPTLFLGRLFNLAFFVWLSYLAVKITPTGKSILAAVALLPTTFHVAASYSRDSMIIAVSLFYVAYCLYCAYSEKVKELKLSNIAILAVCAILLSSQKTVYFVLALLFLIIPKDKYKNIKWLSLSRWGLLACIFVTLCACNWSMFSNMLNSFLSLFTPTASAAVGETAKYTVAATATEYYTVSYMLTHIPDVVYLVFQTFYDNFFFFYKSMLGGTFGFFDLNVSDLWVVALTVILALAAFDNKDELILKKRDKGFGILICLGVIVLVWLGAITWTETTAAVIYGIQGRYFLPILPLILLCFKNKRLSFEGDLSKTVIFSSCIIEIGVLVNMLASIVKR